MTKNENYPKCKRKDCTLQVRDIITHEKLGKCSALSKVYKDNTCPFYKKHFDDVNGLPKEERESLSLAKSAADTTWKSHIPENDAKLLREYMDWTANLFPNDWKTMNRFFRTAVKAMEERDDMVEKLKEMKAEKEYYCLHLPEDTPNNHEPVLLYGPDGDVVVGYYFGNEDDGGNYYERNSTTPLSEYGWIVVGWRYFPEEGD